MSSSSPRERRNGGGERRRGDFDDARYRSEEEKERFLGRRRRRYSSDSYPDDEDGERRRRRSERYEDDYDARDDRRRHSRGSSRERGEEYRRPRYDDDDDDDDNNNGNPPFERWEIRKGVVRSIQPYGLFVRLMEKEEEEKEEQVEERDRERRRRRPLPDGLVHASQVSNDITFQRDDADEAKVQSLSYFFPTDTIVYAKVLKCERDPARGWKVSLSMKNVDQESGEDKDPENRDNGFNSNSNNNNNDGHRNNNNNNNASTASFTADLFGVYEGKVSSIKPYGVFVNLENTRTSALVHVSEISEHLRFSREDTDEDKIMGIEGVLSVGESCFVKIIEMKPPESERDRMKLSGSIRLVDQKSGEDLDPENMKLRDRRDGGGGGGGDGGRFMKKPVGADAGERVQPGGIVQWGHEKADVKEQSKTAYDFVVDVEDDQKHQPKADDYSKPRFGHGLEGYVPEVLRKEKKRGKEKSSSKDKKKKESKKRKKREKKEKKKKKKKDSKRKKKSKRSYSSSSGSSSSYTSSYSDDDSYSSSY